MIEISNCWTPFLKSDIWDWLGATLAPPGNVKLSTSVDSATKSLYNELINSKKKKNTFDFPHFHCLKDPKFHRETLVKSKKNGIDFILELKSVDFEDSLDVFTPPKLESSFVCSGDGIASFTIEPTRAVAPPFH